MNLPTYKSELTNKLVGLPDDLGSYGQTAEGVQAILQAPIDEVLAYLNDVRKALNTDSAGASQISALGDDGATTVQALIDALEQDMSEHNHDARYYTKEQTYSQTEVDELEITQQQQVQLVPGGSASEAFVGLFPGVKVPKNDSVSFTAALPPNIVSEEMELQVMMACDNTDADKLVKYQAEYISTDGTSAIGGSGTVVTTELIEVPTTTANLPFELTFVLPAGLFVGCKITRLAIDGDPDPIEDPIILSATLLYDVRR
jgi:hypothetical protein